jgi:hypothetical protein
MVGCVVSLGVCCVHDVRIFCAELREENEKQQWDDDGSDRDYGSDDDAGSGEEQTTRRRRPKKPAVVNSAVMAEAIEHGARRTAGIGARMTRGAARKSVALFYRPPCILSDRIS